MGHFKNFKLALYCVAQRLDGADLDTHVKHYEFAEKYVGVDKVYLETYRSGCTVKKEKMLKLIDFFKSRNVEIAGGITVTTPDLSEEDIKRNRLFGTFCFSNRSMRDRLKEIAEYTAELFDEIILDDFFFTNCTCEDCIAAKGDRSFEEYRRELMTGVSEELVIGPAKKVNPKVKITIKYPNWRESYHSTGYLPDIQYRLFDAVYTGTETRSSAYQDQHLPTYLSYSLPLWMDKMSGGKNKGTWFDPYQCWPMEDYLEQGYLSAFSKPAEITLFNMADIYDNRLITPLGFQLEKIDAILEKTGKPKGIPAYIPPASCGEDHIEDFLGMQGFPIIPTPVFPETELVLLTASSLKDEKIYDKIQSKLAHGDKVIVTTGFLAGADKEKWKEFSSSALSGRKLAVNRYHVTDDFAGYTDDAPELLFPDVRHSNNYSWSLLNGGNGEYHISLFLRDAYKEGCLYLMNIPENPYGLSKIPAAALDVAKRVMNIDGVYLSANNASLFMYDNNTVIIYAHVTERNHPVRVKLHASGELFDRLVSLTDGKETVLRKETVPFDFDELYEGVAELVLEPGAFYAYKLC